MDTATSPSAESPTEVFVRLERVTLTYGRGATTVQALTETSLAIAKGDFIALVGPSGCGKSTILKLVTGLIRATSGFTFIYTRTPDHYLTSCPHQTAPSRSPPQRGYAEPAITTI
jgi:ABC-type glutathione transport system ATPase component